MNLVDWIGCIAAVFTTIAFGPQAWKVWRTRHTKDISLAMYGIFTFGVAMWLVYGILLQSWPMIIANIVTLPLALVILVLKIRFG